MSSHCNLVVDLKIRATIEMQSRKNNLINFFYTVPYTTNAIVRLALSHYVAASSVCADECKVTFRYQTAISN